jgi:hypothetical protein
MKGAAQTLQGYREVYLRPGLDSGVFNSEDRLDNRFQAPPEQIWRDMINSDRPQQVSSPEAPPNPMVELSEAGYLALVHDEFQG